LAPQVSQVELLGEIPVTAEECAELGRLVGLHVRGRGLIQAARILRFEYPCSFAVFLVAQGVHGYDEHGSYWPGVSQAIAKTLDGNWAREFGLLFEEILVSLDLSLFPGLGGRRYVDLILVHGGIPDYSLPDFFCHMLQPSVTRAYYADMSAEELIDEWLWHASGRYFTDKPVLRFLETGDAVALDFVERCREMAWEYIDSSGTVPEAGQVGLPKRVVEAYAQWIATQTPDVVTAEPVDRWRLRKPQMLVDPWGEGVILDLPPQQVPAAAVDAEIAWQVTAGEETHDVPVRVRRVGFDLKTEPESLPLSRPAAVYKVSLLADGQVKRTWRFQGVDDERPLLAFDPERGTLLSWKNTLPARRLGLLYPAQLELEVEEAELQEELPRLPWGWAGFRGQTWDLSRSTRLTLQRNGSALLTITLRPDETKQRPQLCGGQLLSPAERDSGVRAPVYVGLPPSVQIPLAGRSSLADELARWRVRVHNKWLAVPEVRITTTLAELRSQLSIGEKRVDLPLSVPSMLGEEPFGNYVVRLRGPLGRDAEFTLRIVPRLEITGHETLYLPDPDCGPRPATLSIEATAGDDLECQTEGVVCHVRGDEQSEEGRRYEIEASPDVTEIDLTVVRRLPSRDAVRVPIHLPIRRLRWTLAEEHRGAGARGLFISHRTGWTGRVVSVSVDELLQSRSPFLLVRLPWHDESQPRLELRLLDTDGSELQVSDLASHPKGRQLWRFDLAAFLDTVRNSRLPILRFELRIWDLPGRDAPLSLPVFSLSQTMIVDDVTLSPTHVDGRALFELGWREPSPLRNRQVRLWPLWRPWDPVYEQPIPDEAVGRWAFEVQPSELQSGKYRVEFTVVDPWIASGAVQRPPKDAPGTADIELISAERQLQCLDATVQERGECFELLLERAVVRRDIEATQEISVDCQWCFEHLDEGTIPQVIALLELVRSGGNPRMLTAVQLKMFAPPRIKSLLHAHGRGEVASEHYHNYLANLPRSHLLPLDTCILLLEVKVEAARLFAL
jgi:hypothetical protein